MIQGVLTRNMVGMWCVGFWPKRIGWGIGESVMDKELKDLLERSRSVELTEAEIEENRIELAAANGHLTDERITAETMKATRTIMLSEEELAD